jgi:hypothetical protein
MTPNGNQAPARSERSAPINRTTNCPSFAQRKSATPAQIRDARYLRGIKRGAERDRGGRSAGQRNPTA